MLAEIRDVKQEAVGRRRWFDDDGLELIVWHDPADDVTGFQLCYVLNPDRGEHALTWRAGQEFAHARVQTGDTSPFKNEAPILIPDGPVPWDRLKGLFAARALALEPALREMVLERLERRH